MRRTKLALLALLAAMCLTLEACTAVAADKAQVRQEAIAPGTMAKCKMHGEMKHCATARKGGTGCAVTGGCCMMHGEAEPAADTTPQDSGAAPAEHKH